MVKHAMACLVLIACSDDATSRDTSGISDVIVDEFPSVEFDPIAGNTVRMDFARPDFFAAPFPALDVTADTLDRWPGASENSFVTTLVTLAKAETGASIAGAIYFSLVDPLDPNVVATLTSDATTNGPIQVAPIIEGHVGAAVPVTIAYEDDGGPYGGRNMLSALPVQGIPLLPDTDYVAWVRREPLQLGRGQVASDIMSGRVVAGLDSATQLRMSVLADEDVAGFTVFHTASPANEFLTFVEAARKEPVPDLDDLALIETYDDFCVFTKTVDIPDYQVGTPPFDGEGQGIWQFGPSQSPQRRSPTRLFVTIPRTPAPPSGYPTVIFIRTGGGGDRPLIDRGPRAVAHGDPIVAHGTGPAVNLAAAGWAGITWDGPHGGPRNPTEGDEQFLMFNVLNPAATRDNVRQTALEAVVIQRWLSDIHIDASACVGASAATVLDHAKLALMGHSMGGWVAPIALSARVAGFDAAILSGAGGSWIENVIYKRSPLEVKPLAETILGYDAIGRSLGAHDVTLTLLQWVGEAADPQSYAPLEGDAPNILMIEGIVDTYILPPIANTTALSQHLDLGGEAHDASDPRLDEFVPLTALLPFVDRRQRDLPVTENDFERTRVVVQSPGDAIEDGHEAMFQTVAPKVQYRCFLEDLAAGRVPTVRRVPVNALELDPCD